MWLYRVRHTDRYGEDDCGTYLFFCEDTIESGKITDQRIIDGLDIISFSYAYDSFELEVINLHNIPKI